MAAHRLLSSDIRYFYVLCMICQASSCSLCFQRLGFASPDSQSTSSSHILGSILTSDLYCLILVEELMVLLYHSIASLVMAEYACVSMIFTYLWFVWVLSIWIGARQSALFHSSVCERWPWLDAVDGDFAFVSGDFRAASNSCFLQSFGKLLEFFTISQQIDVVSKLQVAKWLFSDGLWRQ